MEENITLFSIQQKSEKGKDEKHEFAFKTRKKKNCSNFMSVQTNIHFRKDKNSR